MTVLVAYASAHGSTREIAERIARRIEERRHVVRAAVGDVDDVAQYEAVVVGSAVHDQTWLPEATDFLQRHASELALRPLWLFSVGMPGAVAKSLRSLAFREGTKLQHQLDRIVKPYDHRLFSGVVSRDAFPEKRSRLAFRMMGCRYGDFRDWVDIDQWAAGIAGQLDSGRDSGPVAKAQ